jgi:restriction system protein
MTIPDYQTFMLPVLQVLNDGRPRLRREIVDQAAARYDLSEAERSELVPSGKGVTIVGSRIGWAISYLKQADLVRSVSRGVYTISPRGLDVLVRAPSRIDMSYLSQFAEFRQFLVRGRDQESSSNTLNSIEVTETPEEALERAYKRVRRGLESELLQQVRAVSPGFFERIVVDLLLRMGYGGSREEAGRVVGQSGDGGIDGVISEDRLGLDVVYMQAKRWTDTVGRPEIQKFAGALQGHRARKGVFITTSSFSADAEDYTSRIDSRIVLIDGERLATLMYEHGVGVNDESTYKVRSLDTDYFDEA